MTSAIFDESVSKIFLYFFAKCSAVTVEELFISSLLFGISKTLARVDVSVFIILLWIVGF